MISFLRIPSLPDIEELPNLGTLEVAPIRLVPRLFLLHKDRTMRSFRSSSLRDILRHAPRERRLQPPQTRPYTCIFCQQRPQPPTNPARLSPSSTRAISTTPTRSAASPPPQRESIAPQTHYEFFPTALPSGPPPAGHFSIDLKALKREFLQLQSKAHPDTAPHDRKRHAEALSARINEAYKTLANPLLRAQYLLQLRGIDVAEDETLKTEDPELLMEVLDAREAIEDAEREEDLLPMKETNEARIEESVRVLEEAFREDDVQRAKEEAVKLRYWINIKESIDAWERGKPVVLQH
ncbi:molecular chaperone [Zalaria obscura]|uniref:Molecular chaperone n=1 Tax=Zalaria obscura TaxID=2024903 RepID=A0ACC3SB14_9PEZI